MKTLLKENSEWILEDDCDSLPKNSVTFDLNQIKKLLNTIQDAMVELSDHQEGWDDDISEVEDILALLED